MKKVLTKYGYFSVLDRPGIPRIILAGKEESCSGFRKVPLVSRDLCA